MPRGVSNCPHVVGAGTWTWKQIVQCKHGSCAECGIHTVNLWLCLMRECSYIGCGEAIKDHSLIHSQTQKHPLAMNLTTQRVWCTDCNHEVFPNANQPPFVISGYFSTSCRDGKQHPGCSNCAGPPASHTAHTVPTTGTASGGDSHAKHAPSVNDSDSDCEDQSYKPRGLTGLRNLGNTCYMNAALQALSNCQPLTRFFLDCSAFIKPEKNPHLSKSHWKLVTDIWHKKRPSYVVPMTVYNGIKLIHPMFRGYTQQDTQEFLRCYMDQLHEELKSPKQTDSNDDDANYNTTPDYTDCVKSPPTSHSAAHHGRTSSIDSSTGSQSEVDYETCDSGLSSERSSMDMYLSSDDNLTESTALNPANAPDDVLTDDNVPMAALDKKSHSRRMTSQESPGTAKVTGPGISCDDNQMAEDTEQCQLLLHNDDRILTSNNLTETDVTSGDKSCDVPPSYDIAMERDSESSNRTPTFVGEDTGAPLADGLDVTTIGACLQISSSGQETNSLNLNGGRWTSSESRSSIMEECDALLTANDDGNTKSVVGAACEPDIISGRQSTDMARGRHAGVCDVSSVSLTGRDSGNIPAVHGPTKSRVELTGSGAKGVEGCSIMVEKNLNFEEFVNTESSSIGADRRIMDKPGSVIKTDDPDNVIKTDSLVSVIKTDKPGSLIKTDTTVSAINTDDPGSVLMGDDSGSVVINDSRGSVIIASDTGNVVVTETQGGLALTHNSGNAVMSETPGSVITTGNLGDGVDGHGSECREAIPRQESSTDPTEKLSLTRACKMSDSGISSATSSVRSQHSLQLQPHRPAKKAPEYRSVISDIFDGKILSSVQCTTCERISTMKEAFQDLSLPIPNKDHVNMLHSNHPGVLGVSSCGEVNPSWLTWVVTWMKSWFVGPTITLQDCLAAFFSADDLKGENMYSCERCNKLRNGMKFSKVLQLPEILCIHLKRFRHEFMFSSKISSTVSFPLEDLDMKPYLHKDCKCSVTLYDLTAIICHHGTAGGGHYTAYCQNFINDQWYEFDDQYVTEVDVQQVLNCEAYVLFYRKKEDGMVVVRQKAMSLMDLQEDGLLQFFISKQWVNKFNTFAEPGPIDNMDFLCSHGGVHPSKMADVHDLVIPLQRPLWEFLHERFGGGPACTRLFVCAACHEEREKLAQRQKYEREMLLLLMNTLKEDSQSLVDIYYLSMTWFKEWENFVHNKSSDPPGPIDNRAISVMKNGQPVINKLSDNCPISRKMWLFLYDIYGGGPELTSV